MATTLDITGQTYGRWTVKGPAPKRGRHIFWACRCECGTEKEVLGFSLKNGGSVSCGCYHKEVVGKLATKHGLSKHPAYNSWHAMLSRCRLPNDPGYALYGGRGIQVCDQWAKFENFWADMGSTWFKGSSIDRINTDGHYELANCQWATAKQQANNRRDNRLILTSEGVMTIAEVVERYEVDRYSLESGSSKEFLEVTNGGSRANVKRIKTPKGPMSISTAARIFGIKPITIYMRIRRGWPEDRLLEK